MKYDRIVELQELASAGDPDVVELVSWELGLVPETRDVLRAMEEARADEAALDYAAPATAPSDDHLAQLAEEADF